MTKTNTKNMYVMVGNNKLSGEGMKLEVNCH